jgi:hypothetical protein
MMQWKKPKPKQNKKTTGNHIMNKRKIKSPFYFGHLWKDLIASSTILEAKFSHDIQTGSNTISGNDSILLRHFLGTDFTAATHYPKDETYKEDFAGELFVNIEDKNTYTGRQKIYHNDVHRLRSMRYRLAEKQKKTATSFQYKKIHPSRRLERLYFPHAILHNEAFMKEFRWGRQQNGKETQAGYEKRRQKLDLKTRNYLFGLYGNHIANRKSKPDHILFYEDRFGNLSFEYRLKNGIKVHQEYYSNIDFAKRIRMPETHPRFKKKHDSVIPYLKDYYTNQTQNIRIILMFNYILILNTIVKQFIQIHTTKLGKDPLFSNAMLPVREFLLCPLNSGELRKKVKAIQTYARFLRLEKTNNELLKRFIKIYKVFFMTALCYYKYVQLSFDFLTKNIYCNNRRYAYKGSTKLDISICSLMMFILTSNKKYTRQYKCQWGHNHSSTIDTTFFQNIHNNHNDLLDYKLFTKDLIYRKKHVDFVYKEGKKQRMQRQKQKTRK